MKIKFSSLGSIQETELDLRPLTVIIGPNNSNKTYIAYSTYGLWQRAGRILRTPSYTSHNLKINQQGEGTWSLTIDNNLLDLFIKDVEETAKNFKGSTLESFFQDSSRKLFLETSFQLIISRQEVENAIHQLIQQKVFDVMGETSMKISRQDDILFFKIDSEIEEIDISSNNKFTDLNNRIKLSFILIVKAILFPNAFPFPAERNAFVNTYKILENRRYKLLKDAQRAQRELFSTSLFDLSKDQDDILYPQPVEDFLDFLSDINLQEEIEKGYSSDKDEFQKLADEIENQLQNQNRTILKFAHLGRTEIKVLVKTGLEIDLYNASSSIKQLAPLLLYLRYRASKGDFLVIDEPEMNLHPESQAKLLEALSILVSLGVRILLTTHSPYVMAHLENLVNGNHENPEILKRQCSYLYLQDERAFLPIDQVSAYEMKDNKLVSLNDPDSGIKWDTLSDVSVDIQQKFFQIYEAGQGKADETEE